MGRLLKNTTGVDSSEGNHDVLGKSESTTYRHGVASGQAAHPAQQHDWGAMPQIPALVTAVANASRLSSSPGLLPPQVGGGLHQLGSDGAMDNSHHLGRIPNVPIPPTPQAWELMQVIITNISNLNACPI